MLEQLIWKMSESMLMVDDLVERLQNRFPGVQGFEHANILSNISKLYGKKVEYMGKKKVLVASRIAWFGCCFSMVLNFLKPYYSYIIGLSHNHLTIAVIYLTQHDLDLYQRTD